MENKYVDNVEEEYEIEYPLKEFEGLYSITKSGVIRNIKLNTIMKQQLNIKQYLSIKLSKNNINKGFVIHRLLAQQFIDNPNNYEDIDHIDGCKTNNNLNNLRWCSKSENMKNRNGFNGKLYEFVDQLPEDSELIEYYSKHYFQNYFWSRQEQMLYFDNGVRIRKMTERNNHGLLYYSCQDIHDQQVKLYISRLKNDLFNNE